MSSVDKKKKMPRGCHKTVVLEDHSQIVTRWNDNAPINLLSSLLGDKPISSASRYSRPSKKYVDIPQPHVVKMYNNHMGGVYRFDQNQNHLRIKVGGKKWYWSACTWILDAAVQNSWQLCQKSGSKVTLLEHKREYICTVVRQRAPYNLQKWPYDLCSRQFCPL